MSTLTTFVRLIPNVNMNINKHNDMTIVKFGGNDDDDDKKDEFEEQGEDILNPLNDICQNIFKLKQKEHENRLRHIAHVFSICYFFYYVRNSRCRKCL